MQVKQTSKQQVQNKVYYRGDQQTKKVVYNYADPTNPNILYDNIGSLKDAEEEERWCPYCGALYFNGEETTGGKAIHFFLF